MKNNNPFTQVHSLGCFGVFLITCILVIAGFSLLIRNTLFSALEPLQIPIEAERLAKIKSAIVTQTMLMELYGYGAVKHSGDVDAWKQQFQQTSAALDLQLAELQPPFVPASELNALQSGQQRFRQLFDTLGDDPQQSMRTLVDARQQADEMTTIIDNLKMKIEARAAPLEQAFRTQNIINIQAGILLLVLMPILAAGAYLSTGNINQPILDLINAAVALDGGQFRPELLEQVRHRRDAIGQMARTMLSTCATLQQQERTLDDRITALRTELHEERQQKLFYAVHRATQSPEE